MDYFNKINFNEINDIQTFSIIFYTIFGSIVICSLVCYKCNKCNKYKNNRLQIKNSIISNKNKYSV